MSDTPRELTPEEYIQHQQEVIADLTDYYEECDLLQDMWRKRYAKAEAEIARLRAELEQTEAQAAAMREAINSMLPYVQEPAECEIYGYGSCISNPHDYSPDYECCSAEEIKNWEEACKKYDAGEPIENHFWGIGVCIHRDEDASTVLEKTRKALSSDAGAALLEEVRRLRIESQVLSDLMEFIDTLGSLEIMCPEWCCCYEENPCSFQLEWMARRNIQGREAADKWASSACESGTSEMEGDHEAE